MFTGICLLFAAILIALIAVGVALSFSQADGAFGKGTVCIMVAFAGFGFLSGLVFEHWLAWPLGPEIILGGVVLTLSVISGIFGVIYGSDPEGRAAGRASLLIGGAIFLFLFGVGFFADHFVRVTGIA